MVDERDLTAQEAWLQENPNAGFHPEADSRHKRFIDDLINAGGLERARTTYELVAVRVLPDNLDPSDIICCIVVRNEHARLPALLAHYRSLGVARFLVVDNGSTDATSEFLKQQDDVSLWVSELPFARANYGAAWFQIMLQGIALKRWTLTVDADEFLWYPDWESTGLRELCDTLDAKGERAYPAVLLDMYSNQPIADTHLPDGVQPWRICRFHDRRAYHSAHDRAGPFANQRGLWGGVRRRVFGGDSAAYCLSKVPLLKFDEDTVLVGGQHFTNVACGSERGALLHFKFIDSFAERVGRERAGGHRAGASAEYDNYAGELTVDPELSLYTPDESVELGTSADLVNAGIMGPVPDMEVADRQADALLRMAMVRLAGGEDQRARGLAERAAVVVPTSVGPRIMAAELAAQAGDLESAVSRAEEADAAAPNHPYIHRFVDELANKANARVAMGGPLSFELAFRSASLQQTVEMPQVTGPGRLDLQAFDQYPDRRNRWAAALESLKALHQTGAPLLDECVDLTFGMPVEGSYRRVVHQQPWVGLVHGSSAKEASESGFRHQNLQRLFDGAELQRSLSECVGLFTFAREEAEWVRDRTGLPVDVIPRPVQPSPTPFDVEEFHRSPDRMIVQPGWWLARSNAVYALPVMSGNSAGFTKAVAFDAANSRVARGLVKFQRQFGDLNVDPAAALNTRILGEIDRHHLHSLLRDNVVFADLIAAPANSIVSACLEAATPILLNRLPELVDVLGVDYPLFYDSLDHAAELVVELDIVMAAHHHLAARTETKNRTAEPAESVAASSVLVRLAP